MLRWSITSLAVRIRCLARSQAHNWREISNVNDSWLADLSEKGFLVNSCLFVRANHAGNSGEEKCFLVTIHGGGGNICTSLVCRPPHATSPQL